jgi:DNA topoisomerase-2
MDYSGPSYVEVQYTLDFQKLGYHSLQYTDHDIALIHKHVIDSSLTSKITTSFNGLKYDMRDIKKYVTLLSNVNPKAGKVVHVVPPMGIAPSQEYNKQYWKHVNALPMIELCIIETPDNPASLAYTNGIPNRYGGVHLDESISSTSDIMIKKINSMFDKIGNKGILNKKDLRKHITCIIIVRLLNPVFDSQSKTALKSPKIKVNFTEEEEAQFSKFNLLYKRLLEEVEGKALQALKKLDGKKTRHINVDDCEDANYAGCKGKSDKCVLMLTEGKSAKGYATEALQHVPGKRDYFGTFPLRGKPINTINASLMSIVNNVVIRDLKEVLGIKEGVDYTVDSNFGTLRYGKILIMADADEDGKHIVGLLLALFHSLYPSLIAREYIMLLRTPIVRVSKGKDNVAFFTHKDYVEWMNLTPTHGKWTHKYLKGLASSNPSEITFDFKNPRYVQVIYDDTSDAFINLAFDEKLSDNRKQWISVLRESLYVETWDRLPISQFIDQELSMFVRDNLGRNIPRLMDGLKESQRKILWGLYTYKSWGSCGKYENGKRKIGKTDINPNGKSIKVGTIASHIQESTAYKHGEACLCNTIVGMAYNFPGSNNIEYFFQDGLFGTRNEVGDDAGSPRYIFAKPSKLLTSIFKYEDFELMDFEEDEGEDQEPKQFYPIIPMLLINGSNGIGSAYSTSIPKHNPLDITKYYKNRLAGIRYQQEPLPWFRGFTGNITGRDINLKKDFDEVEMEIENEEGILETVKMSPGPGVRYTITGSYHMEGNTVHITEIPIGISISKYDKFLDKLREDKKIDEKYNNSKPNEPYFRLMGYKGTPNISDLRLSKTISTSNMIILNENDVPKRYRRVNDILDEFYEKRLVIYEKRKQHLLAEEMKIIPELQEKVRFITDVVDGGITIFRKSKADIIRQLEEKNYNTDIFKSVSLEGCTYEKIESLKAKLQARLDKYRMLLNLKPEEMWIKDLEEFEVEYRKYYKL